MTVWVDNDPPEDKAVGAYLGKLLTWLGYRATVRDIPEPQYKAVIVNAHAKVQVGQAATWGADYPTPSDFFLPDLTCQSFYANPADTNNITGFCDPQADKLASRAQAAQLTDPAAARRLWAQVDRIVTDKAPWAPIFNASTTVFVSARVRNYQASPFYGPLLDQIWIK